jgi:uncharacterized YccA/Bax inhibitor family protein
MSSQMLNEHTFASTPATRGQAAAGTMTLTGTIVKALILLVIAGAFATWGWSVALDWFSQSGLWWLFGYFILIAITIAAVNNPTMAMIAGFLYAVMMGFWMGAISRIYEIVFEGIVAQALLASVGVFLGCLLLYLTGAVKVTAKFRAILFIAMAGVLLMYLFGFILSLFGVDLLMISEPTLAGLLISGGICILAALNLLVDFSVIEEGITRGAPASMEWYAAFGLISTLVWLYAEVLRFLALVRARQG